MELDSLLQFVYDFHMSFPLKIVASDELKVDIHLHEFFLGDRKRQCWTYVTTGLLNLGQKEMCLSLLLEDDDQPDVFPKSPIKIFQLLEKHAREGRIVDVADATTLGKKGLFGFSALYFLPAIQYETLPNLDNHLALILVHQTEYEFAKQYGFTRLISRIGKFCVAFPYPSWNTRKRPSLFDAELETTPDTRQKENSVLNHLRVSGFNECRAELVDKLLTVTLRIPHRERILAALDKLAESGKPFVLQSRLSLGANAILFWEPGQKTPGAYTALNEVAEIGAAFVAFQPSAYAIGSLIEDGFVFSIPKRLIKIIRGHCEELTDSGVLELAGFSLSIKWIDDSHESLQPAIPYQHLAGWIEVGASAEKIYLASVVDITPGNSDSVKESDLSEYIELIRQYLVDTMPVEEEKFNLTIRTKISQASTSHQLNADIDLNPDFTKFMLQGLARITPCPVSNQLTVDLTFIINPQGVDRKQL